MDGEVDVAWWQSWIRDFFSLYGPLGIGWIAAAVLWWKAMYEKPADTIKAYQDVIAAYKEVVHDTRSTIIENTRAMERLATLLEERTRK